MQFAIGPKVFALVLKIFGTYLQIVAFKVGRTSIKQEKNNWLETCEKSEPNDFSSLIVTSWQKFFE